MIEKGKNNYQVQSTKNDMRPDQFRLQLNFHESILLLIQIETSKKVMILFEILLFICYKQI